MAIVAVPHPFTPFSTPLHPFTPFYTPVLRRSNETRALPDQEAARVGYLEAPHRPALLWCATASSSFLLLFKASTCHGNSVRSMTI